jgi:hypothetical protein
MNTPTPTRPTLDTMAQLYRAAATFQSPTALDRVRECIVRHGFEEADVRAKCGLPEFPAKEKVA